MRASIPALFVMYLLCYQYLLKEREILVQKSKPKKDGKVKIKTQDVTPRSFILVICLLIGAVTPGFEFYRGFEQVHLRGINDPLTDDIVTLDHETHPRFEGYEWKPYNFVCVDLDNSLFFKYFSRVEEG